MPPYLITKVLEYLQELWQFNDNIEITMEANPNSTEVVNFASVAIAGVNRVSIGIQSFSNTNLKFLGRTHDRHNAIKAITTAQKVFKRYSFDLMYALPNQTIQELECDLIEASHYLKNHISCYH